MANSKHAHLRYNILDNCFRNKYFGFKDLHKHLNYKIAEFYPGEGISVKTLRDDIKLFKSSINGFDAPLPNNTRIYRYSDRNFSIAKRPLLGYENYLIRAAQELLERFENNPKYDNLVEALIKFQDEDNGDDKEDKILFYDINEEYKGIKHLKPLYFSIRKKQVLQIEYKGFHDDESKIFEFHPQVLKQYNRRWFVYGLNASSSVERWSIPLDSRLIKFNVLDDIEYKKQDVNWDSFFRTMVGVKRNEDSEIRKVVLRFYNGRENFFKTKPFLPDYDEFFDDDKKDQVWFDTILNEELVQQILSYGKDVEVLEPKELKLQMQSHVNAMNAYY